MRVSARHRDRPWQALPREVADRIAPLLDGITAEVIAEIHADLPGTAAAGDAFARHLRAGVDEAYRQLHQEIGTPTAEPDREAYVRFGRLQCRAGRAFDEMQAFYRLSALVFWRRVAAAGRRGELSVETVGLLGETAIAFIHELSLAAAEGYVQEQSRVEQATRRRRHDLVRLLVQTPGVGEAEVEQAARSAGWRVPRRVAAVAVAAERGERVADRLPAGVLAAPVGEHLCVLAAGNERAAWRPALTDALLRAGTIAGVGPTVPWSDAARSYARGSAVLRLALAGAVADAGPLVAADAHAVALVLAGDHELARELAERRLAPLASLRLAQRDRLVETLEAWLAHPGQPAAIARRLHLHVQSVHYRLRQLRELFGAALDDPDARFELALALRSRRLHLAESEP